MSAGNVDRTLDLLARFQRMVRKHDHHWDYLDDTWPDDAAVLADLELAEAAVRAQHGRERVASDNVVPIRYTATVELTAAPEPTLWEILVRCEELHWHFSFGIARADAPTEGEALHRAGLYVQELLQRLNPGIQVEPC